MTFELVYTSRAADEEIADEGLGAILEISRRKNAALGITGALFYYSGEFVQLLEGEREAVCHLYYNSIQHDHRHKSAFVCWEYHKAARSFPDWSMGFLARRPDHFLHKNGYLINGSADLPTATQRSIGRDLLLNIVERIHRDTANNALALGKIGLQGR